MHRGPALRPRTQRQAILKTEFGDLDPEINAKETSSDNPQLKYGTSPHHSVIIRKEPVHNLPI